MTLNRMKATAVIFAALAVSAPVWAQPSDEAKPTTATKEIKVDGPELKEALATMKSYDFGKDRTFLFVIDEAIRQSAKKPQQRKKLANDLVDVAMDEDAAYGARELALRRIELIGDGPQVNKIEKLLEHKDERLAEMARESIAGIPADRSNRALLKALETSKGKLQIGIIHALGERQVKGAVKPLTKLARQSDASIAAEAMLALGDIANAEAAKALLDDIRPPDAAREAWFMAMNDAAISMADNNKKTAERLYDRVLQMGENSPARLAAYKGKAILSGKPEVAALKALDENDAMLAQVARELLVRGNDSAITSQLLSRLKTAAPENKVVVVEILGARGDKAALETVSALAEKTDGEQALRVAAIRALESLGNEKVVPVLVAIAAKEKGDIARAAGDTLKKMAIPEVDAELLRLVVSAPTPEEQVVAIESVVARKSTGAMEPLIVAAGKKNSKVSIAAFKAMKDLTTENELDAILKAHAGETEERVLKEAALAIQAAASKGKDKGNNVRTVAGAYKTASNDDVRASLLGVLGNLGYDVSLNILRENLNSDNEKIQDAAVRALAAYPDAKAMDDLLRIASDSQSEIHRVLAIRAVARLLAEPAGKSSVERLELTKKALDLAKGVDEKKAVIGAMAELKVPGVLELLLPFVDQEDCKAESVAAILKQAPIANEFNPGVTAALLNPLKDKLETGQWNKLEEVLTPSESSGSVIRAWSASQVYKLEGGAAGASAALKQEFAPNDQPAEFPEYLWASGDDGGEKQGRLDLRSYYPRVENAAVYLQTNVWSPDDRKARVDSASDDGLRVIFNGQQVFAFDKKRSFDWWSDKTAVDLKRGWNQLILKVGQGSGGWEAAARIVDENGKPMSDLKLSATRQDE